MDVSQGHDMSCPASNGLTRPAISVGGIRVYILNLTLWDVIPLRSGNVSNGLAKEVAAVLI